MDIKKIIKDNFKPLPIKESGFIWLALTVVAFIADFWTKSWAEDALRLGRKIEVMPHFNLQLAYNPGAAGGILEGWTLFLIVVPILIVIALFLWMWQTPKQNKLVNTGLALILGGAFGNIYDRVFNDGKVIDFIDWYIVWDGVEKHWPTFNIADSVIMIGVGLLIIDAIKNPENKAEKNNND